MTAAVTPRALCLIEVPRRHNPAYSPATFFIETYRIKQYQNVGPVGILKIPTGPAFFCVDRLRIISLLNFCIEKFRHDAADFRGIQAAAGE